MALGLLSEFRFPDNSLGSLVQTPVRHSNRFGPDLGYCGGKGGDDKETWLTTLSDFHGEDPKMVRVCAEISGCRVKSVEFAPVPLRTFAHPHKGDPPAPTPPGLLGYDGHRTPTWSSYSHTSHSTPLTGTLGSSRGEWTQRTVSQGPLFSSTSQGEETRTSYPPSGSLFGAQGGGTGNSRTGRSFNPPTPRT